MSVTISALYTPFSRHKYNRKDTMHGEEALPNNVDVKTYSSIAACFRLVDRDGANTGIVGYPMMCTLTTSDPSNYAIVFNIEIPSNMEMDGRFVYDHENKIEYIINEAQDMESDPYILQYSNIDGNIEHVVFRKVYFAHFQNTHMVENYLCTYEPDNAIWDSSVKSAAQNISTVFSDKTQIQQLNPTTMTYVDVSNRAPMKAYICGVGGKGSSCWYFTMDMENMYGSRDDFISNKLFTRYPGLIPYEGQNSTVILYNAANPSRSSMWHGYVPFGHRPYPIANDYVVGGFHLYGGSFIKVTYDGNVFISQPNNNLLINVTGDEVDKVLIIQTRSRYIKIHGFYCPPSIFCVEKPYIYPEKPKIINARITATGINS